MKKLLSIVVPCLFLCLGGLAAQAPAAAPPDQAANDALQSLEEMIERGEVGWWKSQADPGIQFLNKYGGLGGDTVTALSLNQAETLWPSWKPVGTGLERFGIACSVYNCLKSANEGNYNAAVLNALKDFLKYRLSKMGDAVAASAAGVGLIDFALNSFGEAALQQVADDYWLFYCRYQARQQPRLADYVRLITQGDGTRVGFPAVVAALDSFWDDPETHGIRGFSTLKTQDPDYRANFRSRYLKENLLPFLQAWAERERDKAETAAWINLRRLTEELQATVVVVDFALLEKGLNEPPPGATVDVVVEFYSPQPETRVLAAAPAAARNRLEFRLSTALGPNRELPRALKIRLHRANEQAASRDTSNSDFELAWIDPAGAWRREARPGQLIYIAKNPLFTTAWSEFPVTLTGEGADKVTSLLFRRLPVGTAVRLPEVASAPDGASTSLRDGQGRIRLEHGRYLVVSDSDLYVFTHGPVTVSGPTPLTIPVRRAVAQAPAAPDPGAYRQAVGRAADAMRQRQENHRETFAATATALQEYWINTYNALNGYLATARVLRDKLNKELGQPQLSDAQQQAIRDRYEPQITGMEKARDAAERAMWDTTRDEERIASEIHAEAQTRHAAAREELSAAADALGEELNAVVQTLYPVQSEFEQLAGRVVGNTLQTAPNASLDDELKQMRESLAKIEAGLPSLLQAHDRAVALQARYNEAAAAVRDIQTREQQVVYFNPTDRDSEIATLTLKVDAIRNSDLPGQARGLVQKAEQVVAKRRERSRILAAMRREIEELARQLPAVDEPLWRERTAHFRGRADPLFAAAAAPGPADDTPEFRRLQQEIAAFLQAQAAVCGDLLAGAAKTTTPYSRFADTFREFQRQKLYQEATPDFWQGLEQLAWPKTRARHAAVAGLLKLAAEVDYWLEAAPTRESRAQWLAGLRAEFDPKQPVRDVAAQVAQLNRLDAQLRALPESLVARERSAWVLARTQLVRSGRLEAWLREQGRAYVVFSEFNEKPTEQGFYWPETAERGTPQTQQGLPVSLAVRNVAEDAMCLVQESSDGGETWRNSQQWGGRWRSYLPWQGPALRYRALLPGGEFTDNLPAFPHYLPPPS